MDGPSASGKGTVAARLGALLGFAVLDTGLLYRATAVQVLQGGADPHDAAAAELAARSLDVAGFDRPALRTAAAAAAASIVAAHSGVRRALLQFQRDFAAAPPGGAFGAVLDGRDIGTVVLPEARLKLYVTAAPEIRARRRFDELRRHDAAVDYESVLHDLQARDKRDEERAEAPLRMAADAVLIDTGPLDIAGVTAAAAAAAAAVGLLPVAAGACIS